LVIQIFLVKNDASIYEIRTFDDINIAKNTPISPMPLPEEDSEENMLIKIEGNSTTMNMSWRLIDYSDGEEPAGSGNIEWDDGLKKFKIETPNTEVRSVWNQIKFLEGFVPNNLSDFYSIEFFDTDKHPANGEVGEPIYSMDGLFQSINFRTDSGSPINWTVSFDFIQGNVISTLSGNTHQIPTIISKSYIMFDGQRVGFNVLYEEFQNYAVGDRPETTGVVLRYKKSDGVDFWQEKELVLTANTLSPYRYTSNFLIANLNQTAEYKIKISMLTAGGRGEWSDEVVVQ